MTKPTVVDLGWCSFGLIDNCKAANLLDRRNKNYRELVRTPFLFFRKIYMRCYFTKDEITALRDFLIEVTREENK